jgi:hypothetical protein
MFVLVPLFIGVVFVIVIGGILVNVVKGVAEWSNNNAQPELSVNATAVSRRTEVSGGREHHSASTTYYLTFEMPEGQRIEFEVSGSEFGLVAEGDQGTLRHQGTRYLGFARRKVVSEPPLPQVPERLVCAYCGNVLPSGQTKCEGCGWTWRPTSADPDNG